MMDEFVIITRNAGNPMTQEEIYEHELKLKAKYLEERPKMNWHTDISPPGMQVTLEYIFKKIT